MSEDRNRKSPEGSQTRAGEMSEAEIDKTLMESFPASDPPPWTLGTDHKESTNPPTEQPEHDE
ncbi:MAG: hypothetical protein ICV60_03515 [Pyrinomonadaceae bacterium]|nr:hypothetical protein [Pyrinomonadaceae bacterium]